VSLISRASELLAEQLRASLVAGYDNSRDPSGNAWATYTPGSLRRGRRNPVYLADTFAMRESMTVLPTAHGVTVHFDGPGGFHHFGTRHMAARRLVPDMPGDVDASVYSAISRAADELGIADVDAAFKALR
jgi:hypothetical protein